MKYKVLSSEEVQTATGKMYKKAELEGVGQVSVWPDFVGYESVATGAEVEGEILIKGKYKNLVGVGKPTYKATGITEATKVKVQGIKDAQQFKNAGIKMAAASRDATQIIISYPDLLTNPELEIKLKTKWEEWRKWFFDRIDDEPKEFTTPF